MGHRSRSAKLFRNGAVRAGRLGLFLSAYAPLSLIFALRSLPDNVSKWTISAIVPSLAWMLLAVLGVLYIIAALKVARDVTGLDRAFNDVQDRGTEVAGYVATYLLPFLTWAADGWSDYASFIVYFIVIFVIFSKSDLSLVNPTLYVIGWRILGARVAGMTGERALIISRQRPFGDHMRVASLGGGVYVESGRNGKEGQGCQLWIGE